MKSHPAPLFVAVAFAWCSACSGGSDTSQHGSGATNTGSGGNGTGSYSTGGTGASTATGGTGGSIPDGGASGNCSVLVEQHTPDAGVHVAECTAIQYSTNPPCSGEHYPVWANFETFDFPVPRGYWVHSLEHGAVVYSYNCPNGCESEVAEVQTMIDALSSDPACGTTVSRRVILVPDPLLDVRWAASSWGWTLRANCVDRTAFQQFYLDHFGNAPEDICASGGITAANAASTIPSGCGQ